MYVQVEAYTNVYEYTHAFRYIGILPDVQSDSQNSEMFYIHLYMHTYSHIHAGVFMLIHALIKITFFVCVFSFVTGDFCVIFDPHTKYVPGIIHYINPLSSLHAYT